MKYILTILSLCLAGLITAQENINIDFIANVPVGEDGNDIWGWVDKDGTEYAIMGSRTQTWIWTLEDPANPTLRKQIPGASSTWRDIKSWEDHIYVTTDRGNDGLLVIDMSMAPDSIRFQYLQPPIISGTDTTSLGRCHNIYIDENGFAYLAGCAIGYANKAVIFDLNQDKWTPPVVGAHGQVFGGGGYAHDLYVKNNILYASEIYEGQLGIYDVTIKDSLVVMGTQRTGFTFTHNAWTSTDQNYVFTTDERANAFVEAYDISNPSDINFLDHFQPLETQGQGVIPHNTHYFDGYLITSYYTDGVVITDASKPDNLIKTGAYDTYDGPHGGFSGCWGAYPYLPSGLLLASDINSGLYVLNPNYTRAAFLEGTITDAVNGQAINNARLEIEAGQFNYANSDAQGEYKTGIATAGSYTVSVTHPEYETFTAEVEIDNGVVTILDIQMSRIIKADYIFTVINQEDGSPISGAHVLLESDLGMTEFITDENGQIAELLAVRSYKITAGAWAYKTIEMAVAAGTETDITLPLQAGYHDDFRLDLGWESTGNATSGFWERGEPRGTNFNGEQIAPGSDLADDEGILCYVTGNASTSTAAQDDVDDGYVQLKSPLINTAHMQEPHLKFHYWFVVEGGNGPVDDSLRVFLHPSGMDSIELMRLLPDNPEWSSVIDIDLSAFDLDSTDYQISFYTADNIDNGHIVEAAIDGVSITEEFVSSTEYNLAVEFELSPNPFSDNLRIEFTDSEERRFQLFDLNGRRIWGMKSAARTVELSPLIKAGQYILKIVDQEGQVSSKKIVKI